MLINLIVAQFASGMAQIQYFTPEQQAACRDAIYALATHYESAHTKIAAASLIGGATTLVGSRIALSRAGLSRKHRFVLSVLAGYAGLHASTWLSSRFIRQPYERVLLEDADHNDELKGIPRATARQLAGQLNPVWPGDNIVSNYTPYEQATGAYLPMQDDNKGFYEAKAAKVLLTHLAQMPNSLEDND